MTHRRALALLLLATLLWSMAGVVSRQLEAAHSFELTFWRSAFNALTLVLLLPALRGRGYLQQALRQGGPALWLSGLCWAVMFTAFMVALTLTRVANVLVTMALGPLLTALLARLVLGQRLRPRTWAAVALAGVGIGWMFGHELQGAATAALAGTLVALAVPVAAAVNWTLLQHLKDQRTLAAEGASAAAVSAVAVSAAAAGASAAGAATTAGAAKPASADMLPGVLIGGLLSALVSLPLAWPLQASPADLSWLALLGALQLAVPCLMAVAAARVLSAPEMSLLGLLEVVFGVLWAWWGAHEAPSAAVLGGGGLVLLALATNEALALRERRHAGQQRPAQSGRRDRDRDRDRVHGRGH